MPVTGAWTLFVQDRKFRRLWWALLILLSALWAGYFIWSDRSAFVRLPLDVLSTVFVLGLIARLMRLICHHGRVPPGTRLCQQLWQRSAPYMKNTATVMIKSYLLTLIFVDFFGESPVPSEWYVGGVTGLLVWWLLLWSLRRHATRRLLTLFSKKYFAWLQPKLPSDSHLIRQSSSATRIENSASGAKGVCPLGFGSPKS